jgi:hypothetical protein
LQDFERRAFGPWRYRTITAIRESPETYERRLSRERGRGEWAMLSMEGPGGHLGGTSGLLAARASDVGSAAQDAKEDYGRPNP